VPNHAETDLNLIFHALYGDLSSLSGCCWSGGASSKDGVGLPAPPHPDFFCPLSFEMMASPVRAPMHARTPPNRTDNRDVLTLDFAGTFE
jgi:hypothetical protein